MAEFSEAPQHVIDMTRRLIERYHPKLSAANIAVVVRDDPAVQRGKVVFGGVKAFPKDMQPLTEVDFDFLLWVAHDWVDFPERLKPVIDHQLCHCAKSDTGKWVIVGHDIEEFLSIVDRYGAYNLDNRSAINCYKKAADQPKLLEDLPLGSVRTVTISAEKARETVKELEKLA